MTPPSSKVFYSTDSRNKVAVEWVRARSDKSHTGVVKDCGTQAEKSYRHLYVHIWCSRPRPISAQPLEVHMLVKAICAREWSAAPTSKELEEEQQLFENSYPIEKDMSSDGGHGHACSSQQCTSSGNRSQRSRHFWKN